MGVIKPKVCINVGWFIFLFLRGVLMKSRLLALVAALVIASPSVKADGFLNVQNLKDLKKLSAVTSTVAEGVEFVAGDITGENNQDIKLKNISEYSNVVYRILESALEEGELLIKVRDIIFAPFNKAHKDKGITNWNKDTYKAELRDFGVRFLKAFVTELSYATTGKVIGAHLEGKENRIYRKTANAVINPILIAGMFIIIDYVNRCFVSWNPMACNWGWNSNIKETLRECGKGALTSFKKNIFYEILGEILIRAAEGEDDKVDLVKALGLEKLAAYKNEDIKKLFGKK